MYIVMVAYIVIVYIVMVAYIVMACIVVGLPFADDGRMMLEWNMSVKLEFYAVFKRDVAVDSIRCMQDSHFVDPTLQARRRRNQSETSST